LTVTLRQWKGICGPAVSWRNDILKSYLSSRSRFLIDLTIKGFAVKCGKLAAEIGHESWKFVESRQLNLEKRSNQEPS
jgi:hypothetical protein